MAAWEEGLAGNLVTASAMVAGAFVLRRLAPLIAPGVGAFVASGLQLFAEAEFETQDGIIGKLAEQAVGQLLRAMPAGGADHEPQRVAHEIMHRYERAARARSDRHGWHERDKRARYRHHVRKLKEAVTRASHDLPVEKKAYLSQVSAVISEDW